VLAECRSNLVLAAQLDHQPQRLLNSCFFVVCPDTF
jgi:hypothetical protein